jgi:hypothetical protein
MLRWVGVGLTFAVGCAFGLMVLEGGRHGEPGNGPPGVAGSDLNPALWPEFGLREALDRGLVDLKIEGAGLKQMKLIVGATGPKPLRVSVVKGTFFRPMENGRTQNMVAVRSKTLEIPPQQTLHSFVDVACANMRLNVPGSGEKFELGHRAIQPDLRRLLDLPEFDSEEFGIKQYAVWTITDNPDRNHFAEIGLTFGPPAPGQFAFPQYQLTNPISRRIDELFDLAGIDKSRYRLFCNPTSARSVKAQPPPVEWTTLTKWLSDDNPAVRAEAVVQLVTRSDRAKAAPLLARLVADGNRVDPHSPLSEIAQHATGEPLTLGMVAARKLAEWGHWQQLVGEMESPDPTLLGNAVYGLRYGPPESEAALLQAAKAPQPGIRLMVAGSLVTIGAKKQLRDASADNRQIFDTLAILLADTDGEVRRAALQQLVTHNLNLKASAAGVLVAPAVQLFKKDRCPEAATLLRNIGTRQAIEALAEAARDKDFPLRQPAIRELGELGGELAQKTLRAMLDELPPPGRGSESERHVIESAWRKAAGKRHSRE